MGYRIGETLVKIVNIRHKYVVAKISEDLVYYSCETDRNGNPDFDEIARNFGLENIVAVGSVDHAGGGCAYLGVWSSNDSRGATKKLMSNFEKLLPIAYFNIKTAGNFCPDRC